MSGLIVGEVASGYPVTGLSRGRCGMQLPPQPPGSKLVKATLSLYLYGSTGSNGNATFGPLSLYHNSKPDSVISVSDKDYADTKYLLVTSAVVTPSSSAGRYYDVDVTPQIAGDYALGGVTPCPDFRLQVDGLQFLGGLHYYDFAANPFYPIHLDLRFQPILGCATQNPPGTLVLSWATNFGNYTATIRQHPKRPDLGDGHQPTGRCGQLVPGRA